MSKIKRTKHVFVYLYFRVPFPILDFRDTLYVFNKYYIYNKVFLATQDSDPDPDTVNIIIIIIESVFSIIKLN